MKGPISPFISNLKEPTSQATRRGNKQGADGKTERRAVIKYHDDVLLLASELGRSWRLSSKLLRRRKKTEEEGGKRREEIERDGEGDSEYFEIAATFTKSSFTTALNHKSTSNSPSLMR